MEYDEPMLNIIASPPAIRHIYDYLFLVISFNPSAKSSNKWNAVENPVARCQRNSKGKWIAISGAARTNYFF